MVRTIIIILVLFATSVVAADYPVDPSRDSIIAFCLDEVNATGYTSLLTAGKARYLLNKSIGVLCSERPALEKVDTVALTESSPNALLNSDFDRIRGVLKKVTVDGVGLWVALERISIDSIRSKYESEESNKSKSNKGTSPGNYYTHGQYIFTHPVSMAIPAKPDSFIVFYYAIDAKLTSATDSITISPDYMDELLNLVSSEFAKVRQDYTMSDYFRALYGGKK